ARRPRRHGRFQGCADRSKRRGPSAWRRARRERMGRDRTANVQEAWRRSSAWRRCVIFRTRRESHRATREPQGYRRRARRSQRKLPAVSKKAGGRRGELGSRSRATREPARGWTPLAFHLGGAPRELLGRNVFDVRRDRPLVAEGIPYRARAIAIELVLQGSLDRGADGDRLLEDGVAVLDVEAETDGRAADRPRRARAHLGELIGEHEARVADLELGVTDLSLERKTEELLRAEGLLVEIDRRLRTGDDEVRGQRVITLGDWTDRHRLPPS